MNDKKRDHLVVNDDHYLDQDADYCYQCSQTAGRMPFDNQSKQLKNHQHESSNSFHSKNIDQYFNHHKPRHVLKNKHAQMSFTIHQLFSYFKSSNRHSFPILFVNLFLLFLICSTTVISAQQSTCPNAKQINDLKPPNVNLNCDCTQTADGQKAGWEIMCYSVENLHNNESPTNVEKSTTSPIVERTDSNRNSETVEEVTSDNLSLSNFGDERAENDNFFAERLSSNDGNLEYVDELSLYRSVPISFTIKYIANQLVSIECYESVPNFRPAMFQDFKIDEIDTFKIQNCALPDIPFNILFHRASAKVEVPSLRSLKLETLHTQSIDLNQFKKLFVNLESLETLIIDNYELDTNGKGLRMKKRDVGELDSELNVELDSGKKMPFNIRTFEGLEELPVFRSKRQITYNRNNIMSLANNNNNNDFNANNFNSNRLNANNNQQANITNSKQFFMNKMLRSTMLNNALQNAMNNAAASNNNYNNGPTTIYNAGHNTGPPAFNRFKSTPFNFVTPPTSAIFNNPSSAFNSPSTYSPSNKPRHFESNRLINVRAIHNNQKPPPYDLMTTMSSALVTDPMNDHSSMVFRHFDAINPTTHSPPMSRFNGAMPNGNHPFMRGVSRLPNIPTSNLNHFSPSSFHPSTATAFHHHPPSTNPPINFSSNRFVTTPIPFSSSSSSSTTTTLNPISSTTIRAPISAAISSVNSNLHLSNGNQPTLNNLHPQSNPPNSNHPSTNANRVTSSFSLSTSVSSSSSAPPPSSPSANSSDNNLLTSDSRLVSNHFVPTSSNGQPMNAVSNRPLTNSMNLIMSNGSVSSSPPSTINNKTDTTNDSFIGLENHNQPNRMKTPLLTNMLNKRNNTRPASANQVLGANQVGGNREATARKLNLNFNNYFPNLKILKIRSLLTNYDKDNAYFVKEMLTGLASLEAFEFSKNIIYILPNQMFGTLAKLKYLYLNHNQIQQLERDALLNLKVLETLELENNDLKEINEDAFRSLVNLKQIKLKRNKFQQLPERLFSRNRNLVEMDLSQNRDLASLPDNLLKNLNSLHNLSAFDCQLSQISANPQIFFMNAPHLRNLYMRNNRLKYLNMKNLFAFNSELIKLDLSYNDITYLSAEIFSTNSSSLIELNLYANNLVEVPTNLFTNLKNLKILNLGFNNLTEIDVGIFFSLKNLEELDLSKNLLTTVNPKQYALPFGIGTYLRIINLAHNKLMSFAKEFGVVNWSLYLMLTELNLSNNLLQGDIMLPVFYSSKMKLDLRQNQFTTILTDEVELNERTLIELKSSSKDAASKSSKSQVSVFLAHNPLLCDCRLYNFLNYTRSANVKHTNLIEKIIFDTEYLECQQPEKLSRTLIEQLNDGDLSCPITDPKLCPNTCSCQYVSKYRQVDVDCQQKGLSKPPTKVLVMANYEDISLESNDQKLPSKQIDSISLKFQHNKIRNLDAFNSLLYKNNTIRRRSAPMVLDLYLDNNTIDSIPEDFFNLTLNSLTNLTPANSTIKNRKMNGQSQSVYLKTLSITNNKLEYVPVEFLNRLVRLTASETASASASTRKSLPPFKLYLSSNPFNCTPVQQTVFRKQIATSSANVSEQQEAANDECYVKEMKNWLTKNYAYVGDLGDIKCFDSMNKNSSKQLIQYTDDQLCPREMEDKSTTLMLLYICIGLTLLLFLLTVFYFKNRQTILAFIYIHIHPVFVCLSSEEELDKEKLYDAFVSYSSQDRDVVMELIEKLEKPSKQTNNSLNYLQSRNGLPTFHEANADKIVPDLMNANTGLSAKPTSLKSSNSSNLGPSANDSMSGGNMNSLNSTLQLNSSNDLDENGNFFKLCIHERDWLPGQLISWNIINSVRNSRRTILILSKSFIDSIWFQIEFHTAYYQMLEDKMDRLIVIIKGDLPDKEHLDKDLAFLLSTKTYLVWGKKFFWQKLKYSLPHKKPVKEKNRAMKPLMNGNTLKLHDFGTYSTTPTGLNSLNNRSTLYPNKMSSKAKYMEECINNVISDYYKLDKKSTSQANSSGNEASGGNKKDGYDLEKKMKSNMNRQQEKDKDEDDKKYVGHVNESFENETETET